MNTLASNFKFRIRLLYAVALIAMTAFFLPAAAQESNVAPVAPTGLVLAPADAKLVAGWNPPANNGGAEITGYKVQYKTTSAPDRAGVLGDPYSGWVGAGNSGTSTDVEITGLTNGVSYDVRIAASNGKGNGPWTAAASATPHEDVTWSAILTVDDHVNGGFFGCTINIMDESHDRMAHCSVAMTGDEFAYEGKTYRFIHFLYNKIWDSYTVLLVPSVPAKSALLSADLHIGSDTYALDDRDTVEWNSNNGGSTLIFPRTSAGARGKRCRCSWEPPLRSPRTPP